MRIEDLILVSVDDHVVEPPNMFEGRLPAKYADSAPKFVHRADGSDVWVYEGLELPNIGLNAVAGRPPEEYGFEPTALSEIRPGTYDIHARVKDMDANGVLGSMNFPSFPQFCGQLFSRTADKDVAKAMVEAYNDWHIEDWCGAYPGRFIPLALPMLWDAELAAAEVRRVAEKGCHAFTFSENPAKLGLPSLHSGYWDPLWQAASETGTVVCMHIGSSSTLTVTSEDAPIDVLMTLSPINIVQAATDLVFSPILRKFPDLNVALSEGGIGWVPYFLERVDYVYKHHRAWTHQDFGDKLPSEVFNERVITCFIDDAFGVQSREHLNMDRVTWECDYPHSDSTWPQAPEELSRYLGGLTDEEINKITHENAMRLWQYDPFSVLKREDCTVGALRAKAAGWDVSIKSTATREVEKSRSSSDFAGNANRVVGVN